MVQQNDVSSWRTRQLKRFLKDRNLPVKHYFAKNDLVNDVAAIMSQEQREEMLFNIGVLLSILVVAASLVYIGRKYCNRRRLSRIYYISPRVGYEFCSIVCSLFAVILSKCGLLWLFGTTTKLWH